MPKHLNFFVRITSDVRSAYLTPDGTYRFSIDWVGSMRMTLSALHCAVIDSVMNLKYAEDVEIVFFDEHGKRLRAPLILYTDDPGHYTNHGKVTDDMTFDIRPVILDRHYLSL